MNIETLAAFLLLVLGVGLPCFANHQITLQSHCSSEIWVGILGNTNPEQGGVRLTPYESQTVNFPDHWSGRVWARTGCGSGSCETGDCGGGKFKCNGAGGIPPATLAEITFDGYGGLDYYDVSLVDGYNVKMAMSPKPGTYQSGSGTYYCTRAGCNSDLNVQCPAEQMKIYGRNGQVVACKSACLAFNTDRYCCRGYYNNPQTCTYFSYARIFKEACPQAYSYAYDDQKSTFTCRSNGGTKTAYTVEFCRGVNIETLVIFLLFVIGLGLHVPCLANHQITLQSHCSSEIWVGILGNTNPEKGGVRLVPYESKTVNFPDHWSGRIWARTGCGSGNCETGDCGGGKFKCHGAGGIPPVTLAEITFDGYGGLDYYDVSLVDGYNVKMAMSPKPGTYQSGSGTYYCTRAGCDSDLNVKCPNEQMKVYGTNGQVIACKSACLAFNTDRFCCRDYYNNPQTCTYFSYACIFKEACPQAYSYAYDDQTSTFTCRSNDGTKTAYTVEFC